MLSNNKMVAGAYTASPRRQKPYKNGYSGKTNGFSAHEQEKLKEFKESFDEEFEDTPFQVAVLTYLSYFFLNLFGYLRDFMRKYGLERSKAPKEYGNKVSFVRKQFVSFYCRFEVLEVIDNFKIRQNSLCQLSRVKHEFVGVNHADFKSIVSFSCIYTALQFTDCTFNKVYL